MGTSTPKHFRRARIVALAIPVGLVGLWIAIGKVGWLGPLLADSARAVVGPDAVAKTEDYAYALQDRWNRSVHGNEPPVAYWDVPTASSIPTASAAPLPIHEEPPFRPADVGPMDASWSAPGDGRWLAVEDKRHRDDPPIVWKTLLHPDRKRSWTAVSIVAVDLRRSDLHLVAGRTEPESAKGAPPYERAAMIPAEDQGALIAAWNGGFKAVNGHHGMFIDGVTLVPPRKDSCTIALYDDGALAIRTFSAIEADLPRLRWFRQTPGCMEELGQMHVGLTVDDNTYWGSTLDGGTVIRRSAIGLSSDNKTLFVAIGDSTTAGALARAVKHVGAFSIAQLDVNWSYPKLLFYAPRTPGTSELIATPLCRGFEYNEDDYVRRRSLRDFFYLTRNTRDRASRD